ncbi:tetratricopeptide repeat protein [Blastopirellula marina]|uniref:tetratricopeptide repeat protein n=1 Tax=Blastopirellula marina TaxID=124 RepID=UPI0011B033D8|nr:hypothetical protein [Blastopirellula marina]
MDETDEPIQDYHVEPAQYTGPATIPVGTRSAAPTPPAPKRLFSLSLSPEDEPIAPIPLRPSSIVPTPVRPASAQGGRTQETRIIVHPPEDAAVNQRRANAPFRVHSIHEEKVTNPAAEPGSMPAYDATPEPIPPASFPNQNAAVHDQAFTPQSRFTAADPSAPPTNNPAAAPANPAAESTVAPMAAPSNAPAEPPVAVEPPPMAASPGETPPTETTAPVPGSQSAPQGEAPPQPTLPEPSLSERSPLAVWEIIPGQTTIAELEEAWGAPVRQRRIEDTKHVHLYENHDEFSRVEVALEGETVVSLFLIPREPLTRDIVEAKYDLTRVTPAQVHDPSGRELGVIYPEKGVLLPHPEQPNAGGVDRIVVQPPSAEGYLIRARGRSTLDFRERLEDFRLALSLEPHSAEAWYETAKILQRIGRTEEAFEAARQAMAGIGSLPKHRLLRGRLAASQGSLSGALQSTQEIAEDQTIAPEVRAQAYCQWGDLLQMAGPVKNQEAVAQHVKAIETASPLVNDANRSVRRTAKQVLIDAHLALAVDIAAGDWERKPETVDQWLKRAKVFVDDMVTNEAGTEELRLSLLAQSLTAHSYFEHDFDPGESVDQILGKYRELVSQTDDPFFHRAIEWETGQALSQAMFIENARGRHDAALALVDQAHTYLKGGVTGRDVSMADHLLLGNLYFRAGAIEAVQKQNHQAAVAWYDLSAPHLNDPTLKSIMLDRRGESLVSMGVSYWSIGQRQRGVELSEQGKTLIEAAVVKNPELQQKLLVPLDNLAQMYRQLGDTQKSTQYTASSRKIQQSLDADGMGNGSVQR